MIIDTDNYETLDQIAQRLNVRPKSIRAFKERPELAFTLDGTKYYKKGYNPSPTDKPLAKYDEQYAYISLCFPDSYKQYDEVCDILQNNFKFGKKYPDYRSTRFIHYAKIDNSNRKAGFTFYDKTLRFTGSYSEIFDKGIEGYGKYFISITVPMNKTNFIYEILGENLIDKIDGSYVFIKND